jgi:hypothetical protein
MPTMKTIRLLLLLTPLFLATTTFAAETPASQATGQTEQLDIRQDVGNRETILDLVFGSTPAPPTEHGTLVLDAFIDKNGDGVRGSDEPALTGEIVCTVDKIDYIVPAFIPGLDYNGRYEVRCTGTNYLPTINESNILIERRGAVIEIDLPCRPSSSPR